MRSRPILSFPAISLTAVAPLLLATELLIPAPVRAQATASGGATPGAEFAIDTRLGLTRLSGEWSGLVGASLGIGVAPRLRVGGAVAAALRTARGGRLPTGGEGDIRLGHGGPFLEFDVMRGDRSLIARLLVGGGHATLTDPSTGTRLDADSFVVFEPSVQVGTKLASVVTVSANASYRTVTGSGGLAGVGASDLGGPAMSMVLTWRYARK